jgi:hypothetical protein
MSTIHKNTIRVVFEANQTVYIGLFIYINCIIRVKGLNSSTVSAIIETFIGFLIRVSYFFQLHSLSFSCFMVSLREFSDISNTFLFIGFFFLQVLSLQAFKVCIGNFLYPKRVYDVKLNSYFSLFFFFRSLFYLFVRVIYTTFLMWVTVNFKCLIWIIFFFDLIFFKKKLDRLEAKFGK